MCISRCHNFSDASVIYSLCLLSWMIPELAVLTTIRRTICSLHHLPRITALLQLSCHYPWKQPTGRMCLCKWLCVHVNVGLHAPVCVCVCVSSIFVILLTHLRSALPLSLSLSLIPRSHSHTQQKTKHGGIIEEHTAVRENQWFCHRVKTERLKSVRGSVAALFGHLLGGYSWKNIMQQLLHSIMKGVML